ncbi:MAG: TetR/AcrR family transcriptional regulator [Nitriliruptoraceae bacterium]
MDDLMARLPLRERKRLAAMRRIQSVALDLFEERGFEAITVDEIADAAEVSSSSIYRWFGTKEQIVIWDEYDPTALVAIEAELATAPPLEAVRKVVQATVMAAFASDRERIERRMRIAFENPSVEAASTLQTYQMASLIAQVLADRLGRAVGDLHIQVFSHAFAGGIIGALRHWYDTGFATPISEVFDAPLTLLDQGIDLD